MSDNTELIILIEKAKAEYNKLLSMIENESLLIPTQIIKVDSLISQLDDFGYTPLYIKDFEEIIHNFAGELQINNN